MSRLKRKLRDRLSRSQLPVYFFLVVLLVILLLGLPAYMLYASMLKDQIHAIRQSLIAQVISTYDGRLQEMDRTSVRLAENELLSQFIFREQNGLFDGDEDYQLQLKELHRILAGEEKFSSDIGAIYLYIPETQSVLTRDEAIALKDYPDSGYVSRAAGAGLSAAWSQVRLTNARRVSGYPAQEKVVTLRRPLTHDGLHLDAVLFIDVRMSLFRASGELGSKDAGLVVAGSDGGVIYSSAAAAAQTPAAALGPRMQASPAKRAEFELQADSAYNGWTYTLRISEQRLFGPTQFAARATFALGIVALLAGLLASLYFSRRFHRPLEAALGMRRGGRDSQAETGAPAESLKDAIQGLVQSTQSYASLLEANASAIRGAMLSALLKTGEWPDRPGPGMYLPQGREASFFQVVTCIRDETEELSERDKSLLQYAIHHLIEEWFSAQLPSCGCELTELDDASLQLLVLGPVDRNAAPSEEELLQLLGQIQEQLRPSPHFVWTFGIGRRYEDPDQVPASYRESKLAVQYRVFRGKGGLITFDELQGGDHAQSGTGDEWIKAKDRILAAIRSRHREAAARAVLDLCAWMERPGEAGTSGAALDRSAWQRIHYTGYAVLSEIQQLVAELGGERSSLYLEEKPLARLLESNPTVVDIRAMLLEACQRLIAHLEELPAFSKSSYSASIVEYIKAQYGSQQLSLESTAARFGMNSSYLGQLLRRDTGQTFLQLLTETRVEQAKRLLAGSGSQIQDVAAEVGCGNRSTFIRIFKAQTGLTPSEYRNRVRLHQEGEEGHYG